MLTLLFRAVDLDSDPRSAYPKSSWDRPALRAALAMRKARLDSSSPSVELLRCEAYVLKVMSELDRGGSLGASLELLRAVHFYTGRLLVCANNKG